MPEDWVAYHITALTDVYSCPALYNRFRMIVNYFKGKVDGAAAVSLVTVPPTYQCLALLIVCISCKKIGFDGYTDQQSLQIGPRLVDRKNCSESEEVFGWALQEESGYRTDHLHHYPHSHQQGKGNFVCKVINVIFDRMISFSEKFFPNE